ncbi:MAG: HAMP domain-containing protein [Zoogloeaceae bacterium]|jgi:HPt (histidine-containing phosphotransfer) domain-containing protein/HAMP domain-containing protein|nr:HAMP domain-containing protein [Zoogloeaceae bacterium]
MMNDFLGRKILFILVPLFLLGFLALSGAIIWSVDRSVETETERNLKRITRINEAKLNSFLSNVHVTVAGTAMAFGNLNPSAHNARLQGDRLVIAMLDNENIYNAWVVFEPDAFDGNDQAYRDDYASASSGRYLRSYVRNDDGQGALLVEDRDEEDLNDTTASLWYTTPRDSGKIFTDIAVASLYDYGTGEGSVNSVSVSMPIFRDGKVIGVVGGDVLTRDLVQDSKLAGGIASFILSPENLSVIYASDSRLVGMPLEKLSFSHFADIRKAMQLRQALFLKDETSAALGEPSFVYLKPVYLRDFGGELVYVSVALPTRVVSSAVRQAAFPVAGALLIMLLVFAALFLFVTRYISAPIHRLCATMDAMSAGHMNIRVPEQDKQDEIGVMARALRYVQQQFRMRYAIMQCARQKLDLHLVLNTALYESVSFEESLRRLLRVARVFLGADMASLMILSGGYSRLFALSGKAGEFNARGLVDGPEFEAHATLAATLRGRDYLLLKAGVRSDLNMASLVDIAPRAHAACVLPIRSEGDILRAYLILEVRHAGRAIVHDDGALNFLATRLSCLFARHAAEVEKQVTAAASARLAATQPVVRSFPAPAADLAPTTLLPEPEALGSSAEPERPLLTAVRRLPGLDANHAILMMGGDIDLYLGLLPVAVREIDGALGKMEAFLEQNDDHAFTVLVHGIKGALNSVGALNLGNFAYELEMAAKTTRLEECRERYPEFARKLREFSGALAETLTGGRVADAPETPRAEGDPAALCVDLENIRTALDAYDLAQAGKHLESARRFSYAREKMPVGEATIDAQLENVAHLLESIEYEDASVAVKHLLTILRKEAP